MFGREDNKPLLLPIPRRAVASLASTAIRKMWESFIADDYVLQKQ